MKKKIIAFLLAAAMTLSACPVNVRASVSNNSTIANTKVDIDDDVVLAASAKNADMDYSFLADFAYGQTNREYYYPYIVMLQLYPLHLIPPD